MKLAVLVNIPLLVIGVDKLSLVVVKLEFSATGVKLIITLSLEISPLLSIEAVVIVSLLVEIGITLLIIAVVMTSSVAELFTTSKAVVLVTSSKIL